MLHLLRNIGLLFLVLVVQQTTHAQLPDYHLQLFDYSIGIRPGNYRELVKDKQGFVWILYPGSVQRFDGKRIKEFKLDGNFAHLYCDKKGRIWASAVTAVVRFENDFDGFVEVAVDMQDAKHARAHLFELSNGSLYLLSNEGFHLFDENRHAFAKAADVYRNGKNYSVDVFASRNLSVFFRKADSIYLYDFKSRQISALPSTNNFRIFAVTDDRLFASTWTNETFLYDYATGTQTKVLLPAAYQLTSGKTFSIRSLVQFDSHKYLLVTREGIFEYNSSSNSFKKLNFYQNGYPVIGNDYSNHIFLDDENTAWLLSVAGIARFSLSKQPLGLLRIPQPGNQPQGSVNNVRQMVEDDAGNLWIATGNGFVQWRKSDGLWKIYTAVPDAPNKLNHPSVRGIAYDGKNIILGPTNLGIWIFNPATEQYRRPIYTNDSVKLYIERDFIDDITTLRNGNFLMLGRDGLYLLEGGSYKLSMIDVPAAKENTNRAIERSDDKIWVITGRGVHLLSDSLKHIASMPGPDRHLPLWAGHLRANDDLLITGTGSLYIASYTNNSISVKPFTNRFDGIVLNSVYEDKKGMLWATSEKGIYRFNPSTNELNLLDYADNVQGYGFNANGPYRNKDGIIFFGGANGINYVLPETFDYSTRQLNVFIQNVHSGSNDSSYCDFTELLEIPYSNRSLEVELVAPYYNNADKVKYRYKIEGLDHEWKELGNTNVVRLTSLPSGKYQLLVQASVNDITWVSAKNSFAFRVAKPFWISTWFLVICTAVLSFMLWLYVHNRNKKFQLKQEELETEQAINYISGSIYQQQTVDEILWDVARNCIGRLHFEDCVIYLFDPQKNVLVQKAAYGAKSPEQLTIINPIEIPLGKGITGTVAKTGVAEIVNDTSKDDRYIQDGDFRYSEITVPIMIDTTVLGVIDCEHSKKGFFTQRHLSVLSTIANLCANKIVKAKAEAEKQEAEKVLMATKQKMAEVEMQALRAQMNPHFIFNCLNSINRYIVKSDQATASLYLTRFAKLIRLILDNSNSKTIPLSSELEALRLYIDMEAIRFEKQFSYEIKLSDDLPVDAVCLPPLIIQPYVENAIWHGLLHKEEAGHLTISISGKKETMLVCVIEDNGVGRAKAKELKSKSASTKKSLGMKLTEDRIALLNKQAKIDASVEIEDLYDMNGMASGTRVILKIPVDC
ncbi:sensor histidine kinase [Lacibacter sp.]|uniref:sensor histidine kinase n=1 Tax=Lacibacter sp. TaxID=1915409 RepID=UPI002B4B6BED|nr:histidine kinase [Lacibacter sp.]HLP36740.1 histidine kinase [Lacibacter sp.]